MVIKEIKWKIKIKKDWISKKNKTKHLNLLHIIKIKNLKKRLIDFGNKNM